MVDLADVITESSDRAGDSRLNTIVAVLVSITATFIALCNVKDGNIGQAMAQAQANAVDAWSYYQAKGTKENFAQGMLDQLTIQRDTSSGMSAVVHATLDGKVAEYATKVKLYAGEKRKIKEDAEGFQKEYDRLNFRDDQFDMADASLSLSIALFGVTALTRKNWLLAVGLVFALFGFTLGVSGFCGYALHPEIIAKFLS